MEEGSGAPPMDAGALPSEEDGMVVARSIAVDHMAGDVLERLRAAGIRGILLKGASIRGWLYEDLTPRLYKDCDVLVAPGDVPAAEAVLAAMGMVHPPRDDLPGDKPWHAHAWLHPERPSVDLHQTLIGTRVAPDELWAVLSRRTEPMTVGGVEVEALDAPARALHVALHAAQGGPPVKRPLLDLARGVAKVPIEVWREAARLAERLQAIEAFAAGLRLDPRGAGLAEELGLPEPRSVDVILRATGAPAEALGLDWLTQVPGLRGKVRLVLSKAFPPKEFMRSWSALAARGRAGLVLAYLWRPLWLAGQFPRAFTAWWRARRRAGAR